MRRMVLCGVVVLAVCLWLLPAAAQEGSQEAQAAFDKAKDLFAAKKMDEALKELNRAIDLDPKLYLAYYLRGAIHEMHKRYDEAIADYSKVIEMHPIIGAYIQRGRCYMFKGLPARAMVDFTKAENLNPNEDDIYYNRAYLHYLLKEYDKAHQDITRAQELGKKLPEDFVKLVKQGLSSPRPSPEPKPAEGGEAGRGGEAQPQPAPQPAPRAPAGPATETLPQLIKRALPAVVKIYAYDISNTLATGSGFFLNNQGVLVTNYHVLQNAVRAKALVGKKLYPIKGVPVMSRKPEWDLVLAQVEAPAASYSVLPLARTNPEVGDRVIVLGAPLGFEQSVSEGIVGAVRVVAEEGLPKIPVLQITAPISHGSSGGPVINYQGEVVGVVSFLFLHGQNLNFAIPVQYVRQLQTGAVQPLAKAMLAPETIQAQASYERGVKLYDKKNYQQALTAFLTAVDLYPRYPKAYNYLGLAYRHLDKYEEAQKAFLQAMKLNPQNAVYVYNLGMLYYHAEHYKDAVQAFANAAKLAPKDPDAYFMLGKACLQIKNRVVAVQCYQVLTKLDPGKAQELYKLINK